MSAGTSAGDKKKDRISEIKRPKRLQVKIEEATYWRLRSAAALRGQMGVGLLVEEALRAWLEAESERKKIV